MDWAKVGGIMENKAKRLGEGVQNCEDTMY